MFIEKKILLITWYTYRNVVFMYIHFNIQQQLAIHIYFVNYSIYHIFSTKCYCHLQNGL